MIVLGTTLLNGLSIPKTPRMKIKLRRRCVVPGSERHVVPFHRDTSLVVVNTALNDDFDGAALIYIMNHGEGKKAEVLVSERAAGDVTAHDCTTVHGVSRLAAGVRYNMYIVFESVAGA